MLFEVVYFEQERIPVRGRRSSMDADGQAIDNDRRPKDATTITLHAR